MSLPEAPGDSVSRTELPATRRIDEITSHEQVEVSKCSDRCSVNLRQCLYSDIAVSQEVGIQFDVLVHDPEGSDEL